MNLSQDITLSDFYRYPPVGEDDWRYMYETARVRTLEGTMLSRVLLADMANAPDFAAAAELLSSTEYAIPSNSTDTQIEQMLLERRAAIRAHFAELMLDEELVQLLRAREDFANMRLAIRRLVTEKPLGLDYSNEGAVPAAEFEDILQQENYERLPDYLQDTVEAAVLGYYENKDIRRIDYNIDKMHYQWRIQRAEELGCIFCTSYGRVQVDLYNIKTMLRLKMAERDEKEFFFGSGFVDVDKFIQGLAVPYESISGLFFATPYYEAVEEGVRYLKQEQSFLKLEQQCDDYLMGFLKTTREITAGAQPVIAYFLMKEAEIRAVRMVLTGKKNSLTSKLILDRLGNWHS
jgi:V/A-type H+-transporting ATPase subunit C